MDCSPPGPSVVGFSRQEHWSGLPCPSLGNLPDPGKEPPSPSLEADSLPLSHLGTPSWQNNVTKFDVFVFFSASSTVAFSAFMLLCNRHYRSSFSSLQPEAVPLRSTSPFLRLQPLLIASVFSARCLWVLSSLPPVSGALRCLSVCESRCFPSVGSGCCQAASSSFTPQLWSFMGQILGAIAVFPCLSPPLVFVSWGQTAMDWGPSTAEIYFPFGPGICKSKMKVPAGTVSSGTSPWLAARPPLMPFHRVVPLCLRTPGGPVCL